MKMFRDELEYCKEIKKQVDNIKDLVILLLIWVSMISIIFCVGLGKSYDNIKQDIKELVQWKNNYETSETIHQK